MQIKLFGGYDNLFDLECVVNNWLSTMSDNIVVLDIKFNNGIIAILFESVELVS